MLKGVIATKKQAQLIDCNPGRKNTQTHTHKKGSIIMKKMIALIMAVVMVLSLCTVALATDTTTTTTVTPELPKGSVTASAPTGITSFTVNGDEVVYQKDLVKGSESEVADQVYIRVIDNGGNEDALRNASVVIAKAKGTTVSSPDATLTVSMTSVTATLDLFNKAYHIVIGGTTYILAAGLPEGNLYTDTTTSDAPYLTDLTIRGGTAVVAANNVQNPYMGNTDYTTEWTFVTYTATATATSTISDRSSVSATLTMPTTSSAAGNVLSAAVTGTGAAQAVTLNLKPTAGAPYLQVTNNGVARKYFIFAVDSTSFTAFYGIDFTEAKASSAYLADTAKTGVAKKVDTLEQQATEYFGKVSGKPYGQILVEGTNVSAMDIMHDFAVTYGYGDEVPVGCTYMATLNGLGPSTFGSMSGWMYTNAPQWNADGTAKNNTKWFTAPIGAADYTMFAGATVCWFICTDYTTHPWQ